MNIMDSLKRIAEAGAALGVVVTVVTIFTTVVGGHLPPWVPYAEGQQIQKEQGDESLTQALFAEDFYCDKLKRAKADAQAHPSDAADDDVNKLKRRIRQLEQKISPKQPSSDPC